MEFSGGPLPHIPDDLSIPQFMLDAHHLARPVLSTPRPWYIDGPSGRALYADEIRARVHGLANALHARWNIAEDDVVCIFSPNHIDYPAAVWATHRLGGIVTAANPAYTAPELAHVLRTARARLLLAHPANAAVARAAAAEVGLAPEALLLFSADAAARARGLPTVPELVQEGLARPQAWTERRLGKGGAKTKVAFLSFSSGTTGKPKAVVISHYNLIANCVQIAHRNNHTPYASEAAKAMRAGDVALGVLPFFHIFGLVVLMHFATFYGMSLVVLPKFELAEFLGSIQKYRVNVMWVVPPMIVLLAKHPLTDQYDLSSVRLVTSGAAPLSAELTNQLCAKFPGWLHVGQGFGMTETCTAVTFPRMELRAGTPGSSGRLLDGTAARVVKPDGSLAGVGEPGELLVRGPTVALGYLDNDEATRETFRDGWLHTGDEALFNAAHELFIVDRIKELIKVKAFQVPPAELEGLLLEHAAVADVCVVGLPDEYSGEVPLAFVQLAPDARARVAGDAAAEGALKRDIMQHVSTQKVAYKHLAFVEFVDVVPKNPSGKLLRRVLREQAKAMLAQGKFQRPARAKL